MALAVRVVLAALALSPAHGGGGGGVHVDYSEGGAGWGIPGASDYFPTPGNVCNTGKAQTPINIATSDLVSAPLGKMQCAYEATTSWKMDATVNFLEIIDVNTKGAPLGTSTSTSGNGIIMDSQALKMDGTTAAGLYVPLVRFHFHSPSENMIDGIMYPLEMHMVHQGLAPNSTVKITTVVAVMFKLDPYDTPSPFFTALYGSHALNVSSFKEGTTHDTYIVDTADHQFDVLEQVIKAADPSRYYAFPGSLTTPPCSEGLNWRILATPLPLSRAQLANFLDPLASRQKGYSRGRDNRDIQPLNDRKVFSSYVKASAARGLGLGLPLVAVFVGLTSMF